MFVESMFTAYEKGTRNAVINFIQIGASRLILRGMKTRARIYVWKRRRSVKSYLANIRKKRVTYI